MVSDESSVTATGLSLSTAKARFGHEQGEKISVKVSPQYRRHPRWKGHRQSRARNALRDQAARGKDSCALAPKKLKPGSYQLTAIYSGDRTYHGSAYPAERLTVVK